MRRLAAAVLVLLIAGAAPPGAAEQLAHEVRSSGGAVAFIVRFKDAERRERLLQFALPAQRYAEARQGLTPVDSPEIQRRMNAPIETFIANTRVAWRQAMADRLQALAGTLPDGIRLDWSFQGRELSWSLKGRGVDRATLERHGARLARHLKRASRRINDRRQGELNGYAKRVRAEVLSELKYVRDPGLGSRLRPDYAGLAQAQADLLRPLAAEIETRADGGVRARVALALAFLQTIPYDELQARGAADGTGFAVPAQLLHLNRGDCDSKATALAALMKHLAPDVRTAVVLLPGHAVLAADLPLQPGDRALELDGERLLLMEPAGPAVFRPGRVSPDSRQRIDAGEVLSVVWMTGGPQA